MRRFSSYDWVKTAPGISPTSPAGGNVLVSALGSGVDQNQFLIDGTNVTATGNGVARADPGIDFIQELQIQSVGASVEYGNVQGAVVNVITKSGSDRFRSDASYYSQTAGADEPARATPVQGQLETGYERNKYRDFTHHPRRPGGSRSVVVLLRIPASARLRQSAGHRSGPSEEIRAGQDLREAHLAPGAGAGSWFRAFTMSSGPTPKRRRRPSRAMRPSGSTRRCRR